MNEKKFYVGQKVILRRFGRNGSDTEVTVTKIGRKYVYTDARSYEWAFRIDNGFENSSSSPRYRIGTAEMFAEDDARAAAEKRLRDATSGYHWARNLTTEQIVQIAEMIEESEGK